MSRPHPGTRLRFESFTFVNSLTVNPQILNFYCRPSFPSVVGSFFLLFIIPSVLLYRCYHISHFPVFIHFFSLFDPPLSLSSAPPNPGSPNAVRSPSCPPLSEYLPCPTDTTRCSHPPKTTSNSQRHQRPQSVSQAVSQAASKAASQRAFCFDLKLLSSQSQGCFPLLIHIKDPLKLPKFAF